MGFRNSGTEFGVGLRSGMAESIVGFRSGKTGRKCAESRTKTSETSENVGIRNGAMEWIRRWNSVHDTLVDSVCDKCHIM